MNKRDIRLLPRSYAQRKSMVEVGIALSYVQGLRDPALRIHGRQVSRYAIAVARALGCSNDVVALVACGALLHDIGKLGIPDALLYKPGVLSTEEWCIMHKHPDIGANLLESLSGFAPVAEIVRTHHERYDGSGYPRGLCGSAIPLGARIVAVVDAYAAMVEERIYAAAVSHTTALDELRYCAGTQFDPMVVSAFIACTVQPINDTIHGTEIGRSGLYTSPDRGEVWFS